MERQSLSYGFKRIKIDFALTLAGGELVRKDFSFDRQRNYYIKEIFGESVNMTAIIDYGKQYKLSSEYMFPNSPEKIKNQRFLIEAFATCVLFDRMNSIKSYTTAMDEYQMRYACLQGYEFPFGEMEEIFTRKVREFHNEYTQQLSKGEYEDFRALFEKYADSFNPILKKLEHYIMNLPEILNAQKRKEFNGFERMKADFVFLLAAGEAVQKDCTYDAQVEYYIKAVYGNLNDASAIVNYGKEHQRFSQYMFPNGVEKIHRRKLLMQTFAEYSLMLQVSAAKSYAEVINKNNFRQTCINAYNFPDDDAKNFFVNAIDNFYSMYTQTFNEKNFETFKKLMKKFSAPFNVAFEAVKNRALSRQESINAETQGIFVKLCDRLNVSKRRISFKLRLDSFLEIHIADNSEYVDYIDNIQHAWQDYFPKYQYCDYVAEYIRKEKNVCIIAYGNKLGTIRDENLLFELLASVNIKLAIANGAKNLDALNEYLNLVGESLPNDEARKIFIDTAAKVRATYFPENFKNYGEEITGAVSSYRDGLSYVSDIVIDEINFRAKGTQSETSAPVEVAETVESSAQESPNYNDVIAQKDAEILALQKDLEYYENMNQRDFRNDILQYDKGLTDVFKKLCERKFGAPLNELYLMAAGKKEITPENVKSSMQNFLFVLNSLGVNPYEDNKIGKTVKFESEEANIIYAVDEKKLVDGINKGVLKYPGWKYKGEELVLPIVEVD